MKKKKKGQSKKNDDRLKINGKFDSLFEGIDMNDGDESNAIPVWPKQWVPPTGFDEIQEHFELPTYSIDYVYGGSMNHVSHFKFKFRKICEWTAKAT